MARGDRARFQVELSRENGYARNLAERALAHTVKNKVETTYHCTDLLEQRRLVMETSTPYVTSLL